MRVLFLSLIFMLGLLSCSTLDRPNFFRPQRTPASIAAACRDLVANILAGDFLKEKRAFEAELVKKFGRSKARQIEENLQSLLFIDYADSFQQLLKVYELNESLSAAELRSIYDEGGRQKSFGNFVKSRKWLLDSRPPTDRNTLNQIHKKMMAGGIDGIDTSVLGKTRRVHIIGNAEGEWAVTELQYRELVNNPYISVKRLKKVGQKYAGEIGYPHPDDYTPEVLNMIKKVDPVLAKDLIAYSKNRTGNVEELTERMINRLTEDLLDWFVKQRDQLGKINTPAKLEKFSDLIALFQRNLISIHPFEDGNGRSVRLFSIYYQFWVSGLPPPRLTFVDNDIYVPVKEWGQQILEGSQASSKLLGVLADRLQRDLPLETTPELFLPQSPIVIKISKRIQSPAKTLKDAREIVIDPAQLAEYFYVKVASKQELDNFYENPNSYIKNMIEEYKRFRIKTELDYLHSKFGLEHIHLDFVDADFVATFGNRAYKDKSKWLYKMKRWYSDNTIVWRGLADTENVMQENEIVSMFSDLHYQFVSNNVMGKMRSNSTHEDIMALALDDFEEYNADLLSGRLVKMAKDHSESGELYNISYGYSTSEKRQVGKAFAMGAMVIADYGKQMDHQDQLVSRVLVGMRRANKDVRLPRLKQMMPEFSYKYPRQVETMGIGAADPDSVAFVQTLDAEGKVIFSYVRDPENPARILIFKGEVSDLDNIPANPHRVINL